MSTKPKVGDRVWGVSYKTGHRIEGRYNGLSTRKGCHYVWGERGGNSTCSEVHPLDTPSRSLTIEQIDEVMEMVQELCDQRMLYARMPDFFFADLRSRLEQRAKG